MSAHRHRKQNLPEKICAACGRSFKWRKKWRRDWDSVKYCSNACRRSSKPPSKSQGSSDQRSE
ncbi:MAG: DUF2256 domain-containing protein [Planctomycetota bacterium]